MAAVEGVYELLQTEQSPHVVYPDSAHDFPESVRIEAYDWLDKQLK